ncbi:unnamed protein product, partial [Hapterophycus canaliculatus]
RITRLALVIDSSRVSIDGVWDLVPNLHTLALDGSRLLSFRDLGVGLRNLNTLSLESSFVEDLDGIGALSGLRELRLAYNRVSDVTPLACHGSLQVLGLQHNRVSDMNALELLGSVPFLYSLNLMSNPLMESLGKLRGEKGRGVVRHLIPQIRILDGTHLSGGEGGMIDGQVLDEADDLICQGASRARATWATEEDAEAAALATASVMVSTEGALEDRRRLKGGNGEGGRGKGRGGQHDEPSSLTGSGGHHSCRRRRSNVPSSVVVGAAAGATKVQVGGRGSTSTPLPPERGGIMHWDSDLTQGGRQALFGNPSSAIRRHKWEKGDGVGRNGHSPTRVLETLDLAKTMERSLKQRRELRGTPARHSTQQSADRVSEWRRETCSDSMPQEDSPLASLNGNVLPSRHEAPPLPSSEFEHNLDRQKRAKAKEEEGQGEQRGTPADTASGTAIGTATWASISTISTSGTRGFNAAQADDDVRRMSLMSARTEGGRLLSDRPWTTGDFGRGSRPTTSAAAAVLNAYGTRRPEEKKRAAALASDDSGSRRGHDARLEPHRRRPQTAKEPGRRRGGPDSEDNVTLQNGSRSTSWKPVWESLQTARLVRTPGTAHTAATRMTASMAKEGIGGEEGELLGSSITHVREGLHRKIRSVDFGRQRRARTTARAIHAGRGDFLRESDGSRSAPDDEEAGSSGGDDSDEVRDRSRIKKRASAFASSDETHLSSRAYMVSRPPASDASPSSVLSPFSSVAMRVAAFSESNKAQEWVRDVKPHELKNTSSGYSNAPRLKTRRRETASLVARRSLAVMDADSSSNGSDSSSDDEGMKIQKISKFTRPREEIAQQSAAGNGQGSGCGSTSGVVGGKSNCDSGGWSSSQRRISSTHASRMLGFDLRKSLAAIEEWTDKAPTATKTGSGGGGTPRQGETKPGGRHRPAPFFIEHSPESRTIPAPFSPFDPHNFARRNADDGSLESDTRADGKIPIERHNLTMSERGSAARVKGRIVSKMTSRAGAGGSDGVVGDDDEGEAVLSVAEARAALGISKGVTPEARAITNTTPLFGCARAVPPTAEIDATTAEGRKGFGLVDIAAAASTTSPRATRAPGRTAAEAAPSPGAACSLGTAVGMSDEDLKGMLQKQPRTVPELRTKESFREFFQGMEAERMGRLLRGAYEGSLPADQADKKVKKRLGLVCDMLAW